MITAAIPTRTTATGTRGNEDDEDGDVVEAGVGDCSCTVVAVDNCAVVGGAVAGGCCVTGAGGGGRVTPAGGAGLGAPGGGTPGGGGGGIWAIARQSAGSWSALSGTSGPHRAGVGAGSLYRCIAETARCMLVGRTEKSPVNGKSRLTIRNSVRPMMAARAATMSV